MSTKLKVSFALPTSLKKEIRERVIRDGYGLRGKSRWVTEAIESLLSIKDYPKLISYNDEMSGFNEIETIVIDYKIRKNIEVAVLQIRKQYPTLEGVKSCIFRTAVMQRLLRG